MDLATIALAGGSVLGATGEALKGFGSLGEEKVEYSRPEYANIAAGLVGPRYLGALSQGNLPGYLKNVINSFWASTRAPVSSISQALSPTALGLTLTKAYDNLNKVLTKAAYDSLGATTNYLNQAGSAALSFAVKGRDSQVPQRQEIRQDPLTTAGNVVSAAVTPFIYNKYLNTYQDLFGTSTTQPTTSPKSPNIPPNSIRNMPRIDDTPWIG